MRITNKAYCVFWIATFQEKKTNTRTAKFLNLDNSDIRLRKKKDLNYSCKLYLNMKGLLNWL